MTLVRSIPAMPVQHVATAARFYVERLGFTIRHQDDAGFAIVVRDDVELHLWQADDERWKGRTTGHPVQSGAESFIAGTASCRIEATEVDALYAELAAAAVLHPTDAGSAVDTEWGTREFAALDLEGNLLTFFVWTSPRAR